ISSRHAPRCHKSDTGGIDEGTSRHSQKVRHLRRMRVARGGAECSGCQNSCDRRQPVVVDMLVTCLREEGYRVVGAETSDEGLKLAILSRPELVLLDIALPGMNGIELLKRIRSINPTTRVIMVTGNRPRARS